MNIGFIGLGIMGSRMANNLCKAGYNLSIYNRTKAKAKQLIANGARWVNNPAEVAKQSDILFTMLSTPEAVQEMAFGETGFLENLNVNTLWIDCSTVNPAFTKQMAEEATKRQIRFIDAPVAGTKGPAETGELLFLAGGDVADIQACQPLLDVMGRKTIHIGEQGMGVSLKMVFNLLLGEAMVAFSEALTLGQLLGISQGKLFDILVSSPVVAPFIAGVRPKIENNDYDPNFPLRLMQKDLHLASITANQQGVSLPGVNAIKEIFAQANQYGFANSDFSAVYQFISKNQ